MSNFALDRKGFVCFDVLAFWQLREVMAMQLYVISIEIHSMQETVCRSVLNCCVKIQC